MDENKRKELISKSIISIFPRYSGFKFQSQTEDGDEGVDLAVRELTYRDVGDKRRYQDSGFQIDIQAKSTIRRSIRMTEGFISYDLETKNYNDLIQRRNGRYYVKLILILVVFPNDLNACLEVNEKIVLDSGVYWYFPSEDETETANESTQVIKIPISNKFTVDSFQHLVTEIKSWD